MSYVNRFVLQAQITLLSDNSDERFTTGLIKSIVRKSDSSEHNYMSGRLLATTSAQSFPEGAITVQGWYLIHVFDANDLSASSGVVVYASDGTTRLIECPQKGICMFHADSTNEPLKYKRAAGASDDIEFQYWLFNA